MTDSHTLLDICDPTLRTHALDVCSSPVEVLNHPAIGVAQKRALLASWASDANAVPGVPSLRKIDDATVVALDEILHALKALDAEEKSRRTAFWQASFNRRQATRRRPLLRRRSRDDDDDPPPSPVHAALPPKGGGGAAVAPIEPMLA